MNRAYQTLTDSVTYLYEEKRSQFHAHLRPVTSRELAMGHLKAIRAAEPGASHYCWAYVLGSARQAQSVAYNDDGEPSGTAGRPMLTVLQQRDVGDVLAVVVRTFGGIKLGAGGLVRAYGQAVSHAIDHATLVQVIPTQRCAINAPFHQEQRVRNWLVKQNIQICNAEYGDNVKIIADIPDEKVDIVRQTLREISAGQVKVTHDTSADNQMA